MNVEKKHYFHLYISFYYIALAITLVLLIGLRVVERPNWFLGMMIVLSSFPEIVFYFVNSEFRHNVHLGSILLSFAALLGGFIFTFAKDIPAFVICITWGVLDILRGINQIIISSIALKKHHKVEIINILINIMVVVVGALLCVRLENGVKFHLIMLGVSLMLIGIFEITRFILIKRGLENENM